MLRAAEGEDPHYLEGWLLKYTFDPLIEIDINGNILHKITNFQPLGICYIKQSTIKTFTLPPISQVCPKGNKGEIGQGRIGIPFQ